MPMQSINDVKAISNEGLIGDRYLNKTSYSEPKYPSFYSDPKYLQTLIFLADKNII